MIAIIDMETTTFGWKTLFIEKVIDRTHLTQLRPPDPVALYKGASSSF